MFLRLVVQSPDDTDLARYSSPARMGTPDTIRHTIVQVGYPVRFAWISVRLP